MHAFVLRIADASANRALEGLRVCEDVLRFHYNAAAKTRRLRALRHAIAANLRRFPGYPKTFLLARESRWDVGSKAAAGRVSSLEQLLLINFQRAKEALRSLEECCRLIKPSLAGRFQVSRFQLYTLERDVLLHLASLRRH